MTVTELSERMPYSEIVGWAAHDELTAFEREHARKEAEMRARNR